MMNRKFFIVPLFSFVTIVLSGCSSEKKQELIIIDAKIASGINEKLIPLEVIDIYPPGTSKVYCWFEWKNAEINTSIVAKWHYITDNIPVLDYTFKIPRKEGKGSISLIMPENKALPSGEYKIDLTINSRILTSLLFKVKE